MEESTSEERLKALDGFLDGLTNKELMVTATMIVSNLLVGYPERTPDGWNKILCTICSMATETAHENIKSKAA